MTRAEEFALEAIKGTVLSSLHGGFGRHYLVLCDVTEVHKRCFRARRDEIPEAHADIELPSFHEVIKIGGRKITRRGKELGEVFDETGNAVGFYQELRTVTPPTLFDKILSVTIVSTDLDIADNEGVPLITVLKLQKFGADYIVTAEIAIPPTPAARLL